MKHLYTTITGLLLIIQAMGQFSAGGGYQIALPMKEMKSNINPVHSMTLSGLYRLPGNLNKFSAGITVGIGTYAQKNMEQTFTFTDGSQTVTNVNYSSNMWQLGAELRYDLIKRSSITPYLSTRLGYNNLYANIRIDDPHDADGCHPLDRKTLLRDGTITAGAGAGIKLDMAAFSGSWDRGMAWFDLSVHYTAGGNISYINTRKLSGAATTTSDGATPLNMQFINVNTRNIHQHQVAEVFNTPLRMLQLQVSFFKGF
jgi:hypothetical protein